jgi:hypothetical protein
MRLQVVGNVPDDFLNVRDFSRFRWNNFVLVRAIGIAQAGAGNRRFHGNTLRTGPALLIPLEKKQ